MMIETETEKSQIK